MATRALGVDSTLPMSVAETGFLLDRLGQDCSPLQFLRELTQNAIEAIQALPDGTGEIVWDVDWDWYDLTGVYKLSVTDTGVGMTGEEMERYINQLSSSAARAVAGRQLRRRGEDRGRHAQPRRPGLPLVEGRRRLDDPPLARPRHRASTA